MSLGVWDVGPLDFGKTGAENVYWAAYLILGNGDNTVSIRRWGMVSIWGRDDGV